MGGRSGGRSNARGRSAGRAPEPEPAPEDEPGYDASPDDPDLEGSGLVGAPLVAQMLGGTIIDEVEED